MLQPFFDKLSIGAASSRPFKVRLAMKGDLGSIAALDVDEYQDSSVDEHGLTEWFEKYHLGAFVLEHQSTDRVCRVIGALGLWPITVTTFQKLVEGKLAERDITARQIMPSKKNSRYRHWYVGDIILADEFRQAPGRQEGTKQISRRLPKAVTVLLKEGLERWLKSEHLGQEIELCAIATGKYGGPLLEHFGFQRCFVQGRPVACPNGHAVYKLGTSRDQLKTDLKEQIVRLHHRATRRERRQELIRWIAAILAGVLGTSTVLYSPAAPWLDDYFKDGWRLQLYWFVACAILFSMVRHEAVRLLVLGAAMIPVLQKLFRMI